MQIAISPITNFQYDNASRLQSVTNGSYNVTYSYIANSPLISQIIFTNGGTLRMTTTKSYDYLNRLTQISSLPSAASAVNFGYSYNSANQRTRRTEPDLSYWSYQYDALGQVTWGKKFWSDMGPVAGQQFEYAFDDIGNRTSTKAGGDQNGANLRLANYSGNSLNQYTSRDVPGFVDITGVGITSNSVTVNSQTAYRKGEYFRAQLPVDNSSAPQWTNITVSETGQNSVAGNRFVAKTPESFSYDPDGNLTNDGRWTYSWDAENRLTNMTSRASAPTGSKFKLDFLYDAQGRRIQKIVSTNSAGTYYPQSTNRFVYDGWNLTAVLDSASALVRSFAWGLDLSGTRQGAGGVGGLLEINDNANGVQLVACDGNGNVAALIKGTDGSPSSQYEYGPFGEVLRATGPMAKTNPFRFSTKYQDDEADLLYYGYRYYNVSTGRWLSRDPIDEKGGRNLYCLVFNNPINQVDNLGLLETRFRRNSRTILGGAFNIVSGPWSQPDGFGEGAWTETDTSLSSWIHLWSGPARLGICNSMDGTLPYPQPTGPGEEPQTSEHSGAFTFDARDTCGGKFRLYFGTSRVVKSKGPNGNAMASLWLYGRGETSISVIGDDTKMNSFGTFIDVVLGRKWKSLVYYYPTISFTATQETPLKESEGQAFGYVEFLGFEAL